MSLELLSFAILGRQGMIEQNLRLLPTPDRIDYQDMLPPDLTFAPAIDKAHSLRLEVGARNYLPPTTVNQTTPLILHRGRLVAARLAVAPTILWRFPGTPKESRCRGSPYLCREETQNGRTNALSFASTAPAAV